MSNRAHRRKPLDLDPPTIQPDVEPRGLLARLWRRLAPKTSPGPVCVAEPMNQAEGMMIVGYLRTNGVNAHLLGEHIADGASTFRPTFFGVRVMVAAGEEDDARRLIAEANE